jgi:DNA-binding protein HU-beta
MYCARPEQNRLSERASNFSVARGFKMNKAELVADVAERMGESKLKAEEAVNAVFDALTGALKKGDEVRLPAFGVFDVKETAARTARNPQTGEEVKVPAGRKARFKPGKALKDAMA